MVSGGDFSFKIELKRKLKLKQNVKCTENVIKRT